MKQRGFALTFKKALDKALAAGAILATAPLLGAAAAAVRVRMGSPVLFTQPRVGREGKTFRIYKMRTMTDARDEEGRLLPDAERLTAFGRLLRSTSVDELPQLWNVLRGELSLVGPRPLLLDYVPYYDAVQSRRHEVMPGITGWAQVNGRNALSWEEKFDFDVWYVDHWTPLLDARILARTVLAIIRRDGIASKGHATMPRFDDHVRSLRRSPDS